MRCAGSRTPAAAPAGHPRRLGRRQVSFLRAGLWPRLLRDDTQWLPLKAIRAGRGGAIEGSEGLLAALEDVHRRFALRASRADLRQRVATPERFVALLQELRQAAARRALVSEPPYPLPVLCLDQGEEVFAADAGRESKKLLQLARAAIEADEALLLVTIRSDAYGLMQSARTLTGIDQVPLSLGPVPQGEVARIIREPSEILRRKAGPSAPVFDAAVVERLQAEIAGETDALPLLAFVLQRLMREHALPPRSASRNWNRPAGSRPRSSWRRRPRSPMPGRCPTAPRGARPCGGCSSRGWRASTARARRRSAASRGRANCRPSYCRSPARSPSGGFWW